MKLFLPVLFLFMGLSALAQRPAPDPRIPSLYLLGGPSPAAYRGELGNYQKWSAMFNFSLQWSRHRWLNPALELGTGRIVGNSLGFVPAEGQPNRFFATQLTHASFNLHFNVLKTPTYRVYLSQGLGFARFVVRDDQGNDLANQPLTRAPEEALPTLALALPTGVGAAYYFPNHFGVGVEVGWLNPRTTYLDNIGQWGTGQRDQVFRAKVAVYAPLSYATPEDDQARRERKLQRRQALEEQLRQEKAEFEKDKKANSKAKPTAKKKPAKKQPAKKKQVKKGKKR
jgi:hypothetical protein